MFWIWSRFRGNILNENLKNSDSRVSYFFIFLFKGSCRIFLYSDSKPFCSIIHRLKYILLFVSAFWRYFTKIFERENMLYSTFTVQTLRKFAYKTGYVIENINKCQKTLMKEKYVYFSPSLYTFNILQYIASL